jgi:hypothetical protein
MTLSRTKNKKCTGVPGKEIFHVGRGLLEASVDGGGVGRGCFDVDGVDVGHSRGGGGGGSGGGGAAGGGRGRGAPAFRGGGGGGDGARATPLVAILGIIAVVVAVAGWQGICRTSTPTCRTCWMCSPPIKVATHQQAYFQKEQCLEVCNEASDCCAYFILLKSR